MTQFSTKRQSSENLLLDTPFSPDLKKQHNSHTIQSHPSKGQLYLTMVSFVLIGSGVTIITKVQDSVRTQIEGGMVQWHHPFIQTTFMFFGEILCGLVYRFFLNNHNHSPHLELHGKRRLNPMLYIIPTVLDCLAAACLFTGLTQIAASVYQMIRAFVVVVTAALTVTFLKKKLHTHHFLGIGCVLLGIFLVGLATFLGLNSNEQKITEEDDSKELIGLLMLLCAQVFQGMHLVVQESFLNKGLSQDLSSPLHPLELVGYEGLWGLILHAFILLPLFQYVPCTSSFCSSGVVENTLMAVQELTNNAYLIGLSIAFIVTIAIFNALGVSITSQASAAQRCVVDQTRVIFVWAFFIMSPSSTEAFSVVQLSGFLVLVIGTLVYNQIITIIPTISLINILITHILKIINYSFHKVENIIETKICILSFESTVINLKVITNTVNHQFYLSEI